MLVFSIKGNPEEGFRYIVAIGKGVLLPAHHVFTIMNMLKELLQGLHFRLTFVLFLLFAPVMATSLQAEPFAFALRESGEHAATWRQVEWQPEKTAIIVCDMWDSHHSVTAVRRVNEFAPRLNEVL